MTDTPSDASCTHDKVIFSLQTGGSMCMCVLCLQVFFAPKDYRLTENEKAVLAAFVTAQLHKESGRL